MDDDELKKLRAEFLEAFTVDPIVLEKKQQFAQEAELFRRLWKVDDRKWLNKRRENWKLVKAEFLTYGWSKAEIGQYKKYFMKGDRTKYIDPLTKYLLTPIDSPEMALRFFLSSQFDRNDRERIYLTYILTSSKIAAKIPALEPQLQHYIDGVLGREFRRQVADAELGSAFESAFEFEKPSEWCRSFLVAGTRILDGRLNYSGYTQCVDYFLSCLDHADEIYQRALEKLIELARSGVDSDVPTVRDFAREILRQEQRITEAAAGLPDSG